MRYAAVYDINPIGEVRGNQNKKKKVFSAVCFLFSFAKRAPDYFARLYVRWTNAAWLILFDDVHT